MIKDNTNIMNPSLIQNISISKEFKNNLGKIIDLRIYVYKFKIFFDLRNVYVFLTKEERRILKDNLFLQNNLIRDNPCEYISEEIFHYMMGLIHGGHKIKDWYHYEGFKLIQEIKKNVGSNPWVEKEDVYLTASEYLRILGYKSMQGTNYATGIFLNTFFPNNKKIVVRESFHKEKYEATVYLYCSEISEQLIKWANQRNFPKQELNEHGDLVF